MGANTTNQNNKQDPQDPPATNHNISAHNASSPTRTESFLAIRSFFYELEKPPMDRHH
jgi:hypothetical protein